METLLIEVKKMKKYFTKPVVYSLYGTCVFLLMIGLVVLAKNEKVATLKGPNHAYDVLNQVSLPVSKETDVIIGRPYLESAVKVVQDFYDYQAGEEDQQKSIIYYEDTYIQNTGVSYALDGEEFNALAVLDGEVVEVKEDPLLGNSVTIKHSSSVKTVYQSITDIEVKEGDTDTKGMIIGKSGTSNISSDLGVHLYFELIIDNISVNPEEYYNKTL